MTDQCPHTPGPFCERVIVAEQQIKAIKDGLAVIHTDIRDIKSAQENQAQALASARGGLRMLMILGGLVAAGASFITVKIQGILQ